MAAATSTKSTWTQYGEVVMTVVVDKGQFLSGGALLENLDSGVWKEIACDFISTYMAKPNDAALSTSVREEKTKDNNGGEDENKNSGFTVFHRLIKWSEDDGKTVKEALDSVKRVDERSKDKKFASLQSVSVYERVPNTEGMELQVAMYIVKWVIAKTTLNFIGPDSFTLQLIVTLSPNNDPPIPY